MDKVVHCIHRQELSTACAFPTSMVCYKSVNTERDLTLWVYDFGSVTAMGAWAKICASIVAQVTFPFPGGKDGGLASTRLIAPSERANNMVTV